MATTSVSDVIVPEIFLPYVVQRTTELSAFVQAGVVSADAQFASLANGGGQTVNMPFWNDLSGDDQLVTEGASLTTKKITAAQDIAVFSIRGDAWATHDLAKYLSGDDPMGQIGNLVADYWQRKLQKQVFALLKGVFGAASMSANLAEIHHTSGGAGGATADNRFNGRTFIDAKQKMGDHKELLTAIAVHSATEASLAKQDLIDFIPDSEGKAMIKTFQGLRVIIDDGMPVETIDGELVYTTYLFGQSAVALGVSSTNDPVEGGSPGSTWQLEFTRDGLGNVSVMINRRRFILHARGVKWTGNTMAAESPTNAEFETALNWTRVYDPKLIRVVKFKHNIA